ncbi:ATP-binding protein [Desertibacillus haloalkaliphilus]|uniref:ATP-binding protein n=1 Tax=Desertibacillus haloalkaliphilus TaxID=1328930 RepID=UPI001C2764AA|nr:ATP-binding protein [Desertibacillus haloalkaliphilus]MBU8908541.1 ATP-binding protein [Desertibacillus haloalkaliphilus]
MKAVADLIGANTNTDFDQLIQSQRKVDEFVCSGCNELVEVIEAPILFGPDKGEWMTGQRGCKCDDIKIGKETKKNLLSGKAGVLFRDNSLINPALENASFENFETNTQDLYKAKQQSEDYVRSFDPKAPKNLIFQGVFGTGKSHLSMSICRSLKEQGYAAVFISTPKLLTKIRSTYNKNSKYSEEQIITAIAEADLVVFDDIGAEGDIEGWGMQKLFELIDQRSGKNNVYTTNLSSNEFETTKSLRRIFSRMMDNANPIILNGMDYRRRHFKKES